MNHKFVNYTVMKADEINFALGTDRQGKPSIQMFSGAEAAAVALAAPRRNRPRRRILRLESPRRA